MNPMPPRGDQGPRETADVETSSERYAERFSGPAGRWMLEVQAGIVRERLDAGTGDRILDVGGGHGQLALPLCREGRRVVIVGSRASCGRRVAPVVEDGRCAFVVSDLLELPFPDHSFDTVLCFRLLPHCRRWRTLVGELCRVAGRSVVVDYPTSQSLNRLGPALFGIKRRIEGDTRPWTLFRHAEIDDAFAAAGFSRRFSRPQFFLPMVLHRVLGAPRVSAALEGACRKAGLTPRWGSPVIAELVRRQPC